MSENPLWLRDTPSGSGPSNQMPQGPQSQQSAQQPSTAETNAKNARALYWLFKVITMGKHYTFYLFINFAN